MRQIEAVTRETQAGQASPTTRQPSSRPLLWVALLTTALIVHFWIAEPGTFPGWDESVFYSQTGDIAGVDSEPSYYAPSREPGTPALIGALRLGGLNLESTRIAFSVAYLGIVAVAFFLLSPALRWGSVAGFVVATGHWIPLAYSSRFFGVPLAAALLLLAVSFGYRLIVETEFWRDLWWATGLTVASVGMLAMRHLEAPIAAVVVFVVLGWFAARQGRQKLLAVTAAAFVSVLLFGAIEGIRAIYYNGSVAAWIEALSSQLSGVGLNDDTELTRLWKIGGSLAGGYHMWIAGRIPTITWALTGFAGLVLLGHVVHHGWFRKSSSQDRTSSSSDPGARLLWGTGLLLVGAYLGLFILGRYPSSPKDRYLMWFVAAGALLLALVLRRADRTWGLVALGLAGTIWLIGNLMAADYDVQHFFENGVSLREIGSTMHLLAGDSECEARVRHSAPSLQLASGCNVRRVTSINEAQAWLEASDHETIRFLVYPKAADLQEVPGWFIASGPESSVDLWYRPAGS